MQFSIGTAKADVDIDRAVIAGWTGRDAAAVQHHIDELAEIGVAPPSGVPLFYRVSSALLTQADRIEVLGDQTSGEAEPLVVQRAGKRWLGLASDHTDRALEAHSVAASKQICAKPCAAALWDFDEVAGHLDRLELRSWIAGQTGDWTLYQEGTLAAIRPLASLCEAGGMRDGAAMLCGTLAAIGGVRAAPHFRATLTDPVLGREITLEYAAISLPEIS